jgi:hypothetical protein
MLDKIELLRKQPKHIRNRYAFWIAFSITLLIALIWILLLSAQLSSKNTVPQEHTDEAGSFSRTLSDITLRFKDIFAQMRTRVEYIKEEQTSKGTKPDVIDLNALVASSTMRKSTSTYTNDVLITATTSVQASTTAQ